MSKILSQGNWWVINKKFTQKVGLDASVILSDLIDRFEWFEKNSKLTPDGYFYVLKEDIEKDTTLSSFRQTKATTILVENNLVEIKKIGIPQKLFYKINSLKIHKMVFDLHSSDDDE